MKEEITYTCWLEGQNEGDGKTIKAPNIKEAALRAVDIWRHENWRELAGDSITIYIRNEDREVSKIKVNSNDESNFSGLST